MAARVLNVTDANFIGTKEEVSKGFELLVQTGVVNMVRPNFVFLSKPIDNKIAMAVSDSMVLEQKKRRRV